MAQRPADQLLTVLNRGAKDGHAWCVSTLQHVLERGGRLTDGERKRLQDIRDEASHTGNASRARRGGTSSLQPMGNWRPKGMS